MGHAEKLQQELDEIHRKERVDPTAKWLRDTIIGIVDEEIDVFIEVERQADGLVVFHVQVAKNDVGKVIGKQGRTARSLRTLLGCRGMKDKMRYALDIVECEPAPTCTDASYELTLRGIEKHTVIEKPFTCLTLCKCGHPESIHSDSDPDGTGRTCLESNGKDFCDCLEFEPS